MTEAATLLMLLLGAHWVCDYPLQSDFLARAKAEGPLRVYHLLTHSGIHGWAVMMVTGSFILAMVEWALHTIIDELKIRNRTTFAFDQALHIGCKIAYVAVIFWIAPR